MPRYAATPQLSSNYAQRKPEWLKMKLAGGGSSPRVAGTLSVLGLHTVCEEAFCPNIGECWGGGTATIMLMGDTCSRGCRFCYVKSGNLRGYLDSLEPPRVARAVLEWGLKYVVLTSVNRDDVEDGGASHFARTVQEIKKADERVLVEVLVPDFNGDLDCIAKVVDSNPDVLAHNVETTEFLTATVRDRRAGYRQSLQVLRIAKKLNPKQYTKSSLMLGLGETEEEVYRTMADLRLVGVDFLTVGQYLQPSRGHLPVERYVKPSEFDDYRRMAEELGFLYVASGPLVRSSYRAGEFFIESIIRRRSETH